MLQAIVENLFATYNINDYDLTALKSAGLPQELMSTIEQTSQRFSAEPRRQKRLSKINQKIKLTQDFEGFDDFEEPELAEEFEEEDEFDSDAIYSRTEPFNEFEQRSIDQHMFIFPDYCVCLKPNEIMAKTVCQRQAALIENPSLDHLYPNDSEQIEWVLDYHEPYDFCYDVWLRDGVSYEPEGRTIIAEDAGDDYIRPEQTQEEKDYFYWLDQYTSNIKWNAHKVQKEALEKWQSLSGDKGEPPKQINMDINGYWNQTGFCTCHEPNFLPPALITTFQVLGAIWQIDTQIWFQLPWTVLVWVWNLVDFILDWIFIGIFFWFKPIAYVFIWIINVAQLPINIFGWLNEFLTGLHKLPLEFWMWFFGDGCFLRWGKNCWTDSMIPFRNDRTFMDISIFGKGLDVEPVAEPSKPTFTNKSSWSTDFDQRFSFDDIIASIEQWEMEAKINKFIEERKQARDQRLIQQQVDFDSSALGMLLIQLQALVNDVVSPIDF